MAISTEGKLGLALGLLGLGGAGAMSELPHPWNDIVGWTAIIVALIGGIFLFFHHFRIKFRYSIVALLCLTLGIGWYFWRGLTLIAPTPNIAAELKLQGSPIGWLPQIAILRPGQNHSLISGLGFSGFNLTDDFIQINNAYMESNIDGGRLDLKMITSNNDQEIFIVPPKESNAIPPYATVHLVSKFKDDGLSDKDFLESWSEISLVIEYNGKKQTILYNRQMIKAALSVIYPHASPRN